MSKWVEGKIVEQKQWAPGLFSLFVEAEIAPFIAGQFAQLSLTPGEPKVFRPYSFASAPHEPLLEFYYDLIEQGTLTPSLVQKKAGDPIWVGQRAAGKFTLSEVPTASTLWMMATGTGFGVFLSLLKTPEPWERFEKIVLVHSVRTAASLTHQSLIQSWQQQFPQQFHWLPIVTREEQAGLFSQRIPDLLQSRQLESYLDEEIAVNRSQIMLCGNPAMVAQVSEVLQARGLQPNRFRQPGHITTENYWKL